MKTLPFLFLLIVFSSTGPVSAQAQKPPPKERTATPEETTKAKPKTKFFGKKQVRFLNAAIPQVGEIQKLSQDGIQYDLPDAVADEAGHTLIAHLTWDGKKDRLVLLRETTAGLKRKDGLVAEGVLHQPAIAIDEKETVWVFWAETSEDSTVNLKGRPWTERNGLGKTITLADSDAAEAFVDAGTDSKGRVWITWQSLRAGEADVFARYFDNQKCKWSKELAVSDAQGGDWEPRIAFDKWGNAWIIYDSSRGNEFNLYLARVEPDGKVTEYPIGHSSKYEARASIVATSDGEGFW
ncbi:MAG: hypothetical protein VX371_01995, partial [Verrucomicrobiota bacterium]|nr:hypothetical protein [Verrucomicrobiota bacterium]